MRARAESTASTRERILRAIIDLAMAEMSVDVTLEQVAGRAGTSVQTILRHFGSRDALVAEATEQGAAEVAEERRAPGGGVDANLTLLVDHYESRGRFVLSLLDRDDAAAQAVTTPGKDLHRRWVEEVFGPRLPDRGRDALVDMLVVVTDVYAWKLLRLDRGLDRAATEDRIRAMARAILNGVSR
jgi:AcrR family transcriptional regulator